MIVLDRKTKIGAKVTDGRQKGIIYGFGEALNENHFIVIVDWDDGTLNQYIRNDRLRHVDE